METETPLNKALSAAILRLLRPLVRVLLRNGISYSGFADLAKWVFVDIAAKEFGVPGRKQTDSRISVITGLTRKEVARIKGIDTPDDTAAEQSTTGLRGSSAVGCGTGTLPTAMERPPCLPSTAMQALANWSEFTAAT